MAQQKITGGVVDTTQEYKKQHPDDALDALFRMQTCYMSNEHNRRNRRRCFDYTYGNQWRDRIQVADGEWMTEEDYLRSIGQTPLQNNLIRRLVRAALGAYRSQSKEPVCVARDRNEQELGDTMSTTLQCNWQKNKMKELNARSFEEFLVSGMIIHRKWYGRNAKGDCDCWTSYVSPDMFIVDGVMRDFRTWDCSLVGEIHDISFTELIQTFARTKKDYEKLSREYSLAKDARYFGQRFDRFFSRYDGESKNSFLLPNDPSVCRVFELWTLENKSGYHCHDYLDGSVFTCSIEDYDSEVTEENKKRIQMARSVGVPEEIINQAMDVADYVSEYDTLGELTMPKEVKLITASPYIASVWHYRYITPTGMILAEGDTPYKHGGHPYVFRFYPFINGEIHSFVDDVIDVQKQFNRTLSQTDMITRASSKGALLVPESSIPDDSSIEEMNSKWSKPTAAIKYKDDHGRNPKPTQETGSPNISAQMALLQTFQKLMEDQSGIHGAVQGKPGASSTSGALYAQQAQNSTMTLLDLLDTFSSFEQDCALMDVQNIQQYYDEVKTINIVGGNKSVVYDPRKIRDIIYDIAIGESVSTPAYRQQAQDYYNQWLGAGLITLEQALQFGNFPNGDALLQSIRTQQQMAAEQQQMAQAQQMVPQQMQ